MGQRHAIKNEMEAHKVLINELLELANNLFELNNHLIGFTDLFSGSGGFFLAELMRKNDNGSQKKGKKGKKKN